MLVNSIVFFFHNVFYRIKDLFFLYTLPNDKILDLSKLKAFADDKLKFDKIMISVFDSVENIVGKGENAG